MDKEDVLNKIKVLEISRKVRFWDVEPLKNCVFGFTRRKEGLMYYIRVDYDKIVIWNKYRVVCFGNERHEDFLIIRYFFESVRRLSVAKELVWINNFIRIKRLTKKFNLDDWNSFVSEVVKQFKNVIVK